MSDMPEHIAEPDDDIFRRLVQGLARMGYGRMAQIVDEEWRARDPKHGGLLCLCSLCDTLLDVSSGKPHAWRVP